ncbi:hypothetical protein Aperf_G00000086144 [Anoplocephala perfoliata]
MVSNFGRALLANWKLIFTILFPIALCPIIFCYKGNEGLGTYTLALMAGYWITECISIYATAMLPLLMGPLMGIVTSSTLCADYMKDSIMLFIHGGFLAVAAEHRNVHRRISNAVTRLMGSDPRLLLLGVMLPTWFLSMWMSNAAATVMTLTIAEAMIDKLQALRSNIEEGKNDEEETENEKGILGKQIVDDAYDDFSEVEVANDSDYDLKKLACAFSLGVAYSSSCGGMGTVIGTPTNVVLTGFASNRYGSDTSLNFGSWIAYGVPLSFIMLIVTWAILGIIFIGPKKFFQCRGKDPAREAAIRQILDDERRELGPVGWAEGSAMGILLFVIILWITRKPGVDGWSVITKTETSGTTKTNYVSDCQPAVLGTILLCIWPANLPFRRRDPDEPPVNPLEAVLPWKVAADKCPWTALFLIGGGFALSDICTKSGLATAIGNALAGLGSLPLFVLILIFAFISMLLTTFVSNAATATILLPIMFEVSEKIRIHPFYLCLPVTMAASMAFILPAGTPANAIVYQKGRVTMNQMIFAGFFVAIAGVLLTTVITISLAVPIFSLSSFPSWAEKPAT